MKRFGQRFTAIFFILASLALLIFGRSQTNLIEQSRAQIFEVFIPAIVIVDIPRTATAGFSQWIRRIAVVFSDNEFLREENADLKRQLIASTELEIDNLRLKNLLLIKDGTVTTITASRIVSDSNSPFFKSMLINSGTNDGVKKGHAVVNEEGVVGRTINVSGNSARVLIINDINSRIPVKFSETGVNVILAGDNSGLQKIEFMPPDEKANVGDQILTSGMGGIFPPDLPVGNVSEITELGEIKIEPAVNLNRLNYVSVIEYEIASFPVLNQADAQAQGELEPEEGGAQW
ncbi:MAG: rod shape-determining protein MreC [Kordiimonadaceae bacterium]|jgi:rod shape-determining protein MreC|nr:rod shape-determining protein MreC [Kordiimonadaceae bacterium]MBT6035757.1 rod shape-determining protein MreC [Kordiimonadaceae bacterium]MBT6330768.1 rod shape-determining protein MreC [Kordiimonadaceae bacterium]MBT7582887.1 rod shape-determining protein MreC [Kordiimonadaceae bacterium]